MHKLKFNEQITPSAAKPIAVNDLLKRLKALCHELESLEQENIDRDSLTNVAAQLATSNVLQHKNQGVTAYASCCIADLLRLCAPDAPYSQKQLKSIFECFVKQLKGLGDTEDTYYQQHYYLLESLSTVESVVLLGDIDKGEPLIIDLFRSFFDTAKGDQSRKNVQTHMVSIMTQLIEEIPQLPQDVLKILLVQIPRTAKLPSHAFVGDDSALEMAKVVLSTCADRLQRSVCQYFTDILFDASTHNGREDAERDDEELGNTHSLVHALFTIAPTTLQNVVPQLETELSVEDIVCRTLATETISLMLANTNGSLLIQQYPSTYKAWAGRRNDKSVAIRASWVEGIGQIINGDNGAIHLGEVEKLCIDGLLTRLVDSDERVRSAACSVIENTKYEIAKKRFTPAVLNTFFDRCRDKKHSTQEAAFRHVGRLFDWAYDDIASKDKEAIEKFSPLVNHILHCVYVNDQNLNDLVERTLHEDILKSSQMDDELRISRLLNVLLLADEKSRYAFFAIVGKMQVVYSRYLSHFVKCCDTYNGGVVGDTDSAAAERLQTCTKALVHKLPDPIVAESALQLFAKRNDRRSYKLMTECVDPANDYKSVRKMIKEAVKRAFQVSSQTGETFELILRRASYQVFNRSSVQPLNKSSLGDQGEIADTARYVLSEMAKTHPTLYKAHVAPMTQQITKDPHSATVNSLKALAQFAESFPNDVPSDDAFRTALETLMQTGNPRQAKYAVTIMCNLSDGSAQLSQIVNHMVGNLVFGSETFITELATLAQTSLLVPDCIEDRSSEITTFCAKEVLMKNRTHRIDDDTEQWTDQVDDECMAKCYAIRILGNRLRAYHTADTAAELALPVFKALRSIIVNMGELSREELTPLNVRSRIRLEAARMFLKLATLQIYEKMISPSDFIQIALFAQDLEFNVRKIFLTKLFKYLTAKKLTPRWHAIMFLAAHDPEDEIRIDTRTRAASIAAYHNGKDFLMESMMPRLVHLLAHHPDFSAQDRDDEDLINFSVYFSYYFDAIVSAENLVLVYHYSQRIKQVQDAVYVDDANQDNIHVLSDIAQIVIAHKAEQNNWPLLVYPKRLKLPTDLFKAQTSNLDANIKQTQSFLDEGQREAIRKTLRTSRTPRPRPKPDVDPPATPTKDQRTTKSKKSKKRPRPKAALSTPNSERRSSARKKSRVAVYDDGSGSESGLSDDSESDASM